MYTYIYIYIIHTYIRDNVHIEDFWSWFNLGLVPLFWPEGWDVSEARSNTLAMCTRPRDALESFGWNATVLADMSPGEPELGGPCPEGHDMPQSPLDLFGSPQSPTPTYLLFHTIVGGVRLRQERFEEFRSKQRDPNPKDRFLNTKATIYI